MPNLTNKGLAKNTAEEEDNDWRKSSRRVGTSTKSKDVEKKTNRDELHPYRTKLVVVTAKFPSAFHRHPRHQVQKA
eukprot:CAMPEP_0194510174 /NCGR_PEP_ID=MMETSP0253-20130528/41445_1 /TAXON_ID=2966 /ORGANISM="Noctiluca scintillans" /LENGTH=75 /DNA_ID=CAMNT_0039353395 /DNA_START=149 /DNA_END=376 /DNA_ORIENTATION=-